MKRRALGIPPLALASAMCAARVHAQDSRPESKPASQAPGAGSDAKSWELAAWAYAYSVPNGRDFVQPTITADRDWLHLEARYNYEALDTGSVWAGYNLAGGETLAWTLTPMVGAVFGDTEGVAPGYRGSLGWKRFELYSEGEYLIDTGTRDSNFMYTWSELTFAPVEQIRFGVVIQRTRAYDTDLDIQRGLLLGVNLKRFQFTATIFNLDESPVVAVSAGIGF
jgi:hypothetical protein